MKSRGAVAVNRLFYNRGCSWGLKAPGSSSDQRGLGSAADGRAQAVSATPEDGGCCDDFGGEASRGGGAGGVGLVCPGGGGSGRGVAIIGEAGPHLGRSGARALARKPPPEAGRSHDPRQLIPGEVALLSRQPLTAPDVMPDTICLLKITNMISGGMVMSRTSMNSRLYMLR